MRATRCIFSPSSSLPPLTLINFPPLLLLSHFPPLLSTMTDAFPWPIEMSIGLLQISRSVMIGDEPAHWETLVRNYDALVMLGKELHRRGWKLKIPNQVRAELIRIHARWD